MTREEILENVRKLMVLKEKNKEINIKVEETEKEIADAQNVYINLEVEKNKLSETFEKDFVNALTNMDSIDVEKLSFVEEHPYTFQEYHYDSNVYRFLGVKVCEYGQANHHSKNEVRNVDAQNRTEEDIKVLAEKYLKNKTKEIVKEKLAAEAELESLQSKYIQLNSEYLEVSSLLVGKKNKMTKELKEMNNEILEAKERISTLEKLIERNVKLLKNGEYAKNKYEEYLEIKKLIDRFNRSMELVPQKENELNEKIQKELDRKKDLEEKFKKQKSDLEMIKSESEYMFGQLCATKDIVKELNEAIEYSSNEGLKGFSKEIVAIISQNKKIDKR